MNGDLYFVFSKVFFFLTDPESVIMLIVCVGAVLLWSKWNPTGRFLITLGLVTYFALRIVPVGGLLLSPLEERFAAVESFSQPITGIISLGGSVNTSMTASRDQVAFTSSVERLTEFIRLANKYPEARLYFSGGSSELFKGKLTEADVARRFFAEMGMDMSRVVFESRSRNTVENATLLYDLAKPKDGETWVLITSAAHMPRSIGVFRKAGWDVIAYPVDYRTKKGASYSLGFGGLSSIKAALHEWIGLAVYRLTGRTDEWFPAPKTR